MSVVISTGGDRDLEGMLTLIKELALYERAPEEVDVTIDSFRDYMSRGLFKSFVARDEDDLVGMALFYDAYSTWKGHIVYLDDLVVTQDRRREGLGDLLFNKVVEYCATSGANQLRWHVLDWNTPAINFYEKMDAQLDPAWVTGRLSKDQIVNLQSRNKS